MARSSRVQSEATGLRVREVARARFAEHGYAAVGLEQVAAEAGVTRGAVYHHYGSKEGLFAAVLGDVHREVADEVAAAAAAAPDGPDGWSALEAGCGAFLAAATGAGTRRILLVDGPSVLGWSTWRLGDAASSGRLLRDGLTRLEADGRLGGGGSVDAVAALLSGAMNEAALWIAAADDPAAATEDAWTVLRTLLVALRPAAA